MFTLMLRHEQTFCGGNTSADLEWHYGLQAAPLLLQFRFTLTPQGCSVPAVCGHHILICFQLQWPTTRSTVDIVIKELVPLVVMAALWSGHWLHSHVCFHIDNEAVFAILQECDGPTPPLLFLFLFSFLSIRYTAEHMPGVLSRLTDAPHEITSPCSLPISPRLSRPTSHHRSWTCQLLNSRFGAHWPGSACSQVP